MALDLDGIGPPKIAIGSNLEISKDSHHYFLAVLSYCPSRSLCLSPLGKEYSRALLIRSDICSLCGSAAAHQALLTLSMLEEPHLKVLPDKEENGEMKKIHRLHKLVYQVTCMISIYTRKMPTS